MSTMEREAAAPGLEVERFTRPLSAGRPAGEWLRNDPVYGQLRTMRREDDPTVPQGHWQREIRRADWGAVAALCVDVLERRSRDLQVAAWLMEAWIRLRGFGGARDALVLLAALCEAQWEALFPPLEPDDADARCAPFAWINARLSVLLTLVPVTAPEGTDAVAYHWADLQEALRREARADASPPPAPRRGEPAPPPPEGPTGARFAASLSLTPAPFLAALAAETAAAHGAALRLQGVLDGKLGKAGPTLGRLVEVIRQVKEWAAAEAAARPVPPSAPEPVPPSSPTGPPEEAPMHPPAQVPAPPLMAPRPAGAVASRDEAYRRLAEAAEYLMRTEPHSPTPYLVRRAVAWGGKSLADLIEEFLRDGYDLKTLRGFLGLDVQAPR